MYKLYINFPPPWERLAVRLVAKLAVRLVAKLAARLVALLVAISGTRKDAVAGGFCLQRPVDLGAHPQTSAILDASGFNFSNSQDSFSPLVFFRRIFFQIGFRHQTPNLFLYPFVTSVQRKQV